MMFISHSLSIYEVNTLRKSIELYINKFVIVIFIEWAMKITVNQITMNQIVHTVII
jgi:hypothetical protein